MGSLALATLLVMVGLAYQVVSSCHRDYATGSMAINKVARSIVEKGWREPAVCFDSFTYTLEFSRPPGSEDTPHYEYYALCMFVILLLQLPTLGILHHLNNCCINRTAHLNHILQMAIIFLSLAFGLEICGALVH